MALFKRRKYVPAPIGSALDPYHYPEDSSGEPSAAASPIPQRAPEPHDRIDDRADADARDDDNADGDEGDSRFVPEGG